MPTKPLLKKVNAMLGGQTLCYGCYSETWDYGASRAMLLVYQDGCSSISTFSATKECREQWDSALAGGSAFPTVDLQVTTHKREPTLYQSYKQSTVYQHTLVSYATASNYSEVTVSTHARLPEMVRAKQGVDCVFVFWGGKGHNLVANLPSMPDAQL